VRQGTGDISAVREAIRRLQEGNVLTIFPEGSRSPDGNFQPVAPGVSLIIRRTQAPVVPVCVSGSFQAWPRHRAMFRCHPCRVLFRPPIRLAHLQPAEIVATIERTWREMKEELKKRG